MNDFRPFPKIPRYNRPVIVTEKIDGTNAQVCIEVLDDSEVIADAIQSPTVIAGIGNGHALAVVRAGSRNRWLTLEDDNFGFAAWVRENAEELLALGPGRHFGEWWGKGIQRGYGLAERRFSLFNVQRWDAPNNALFLNAIGVVNAEVPPLCCYVVPILGVGVFGPRMVNISDLLYDLMDYGSVAAPGFMDPEGVIVCHTAGNTLYKATCKDDDKPKGGA